MVERFYGPLTGFEMRPGERGDYVRYSDYAALEAKLAAEHAAHAETKRERDQLLDKLHCMCGSPIDHSAWEGHTPVSVYDYSLDQERFRAEAAEAQLAEARKALDALGAFAFWFQKYPEFKPNPDMQAEMLADLDRARPFIPTRRALEGGRDDA